MSNRHVHPALAAPLNKWATKPTGSQRCPGCGEYYRCLKNGVSVAVYNQAGECVGIWDADRWGCQCGEWLQGFGRGPILKPTDLCISPVGLVDAERQACAQCQAQPYDEQDGTYCSLACRNTALPPTLCAECREPVEFRDDGTEPTLINGRSSHWRHVRTGIISCAPLCACGAAGTNALGNTAFDGAGMRFQAREYVCDGCLTERRKTTLIVERV